MCYDVNETWMTWDSFVAADSTKATATFFSSIFMSEKLSVQQNVVFEAEGEKYRESIMSRLEYMMDEQTTSKSRLRLL